MVYFAGRKIEGLRIFGLTGGIASGKSTLATLMADKLNEELLIIDCDKITR
jgi:dephospho-CoA kinase